MVIHRLQSALAEVVKTSTVKNILRTLTGMSVGINFYKFYSLLLEGSSFKGDSFVSNSISEIK